MNDPAAPSNAAPSTAAPAAADYRASRTALLVALHRAAHPLIEDPPIWSDPLALRILPPEDAAALHADPRAYEPSPLAPFLRAFVVARTRLVDEQLAACRAAGVRQLVVLGAGLDTTAWRATAPDHPQHALPLRVWEVDQPATQAWKRERLQHAGLSIPPNVTLLPVDFERQALPEALAGAGFDATAGALFSWLGVVPYLRREAVRQTLAFIATATRAGGGVLFDYMVSPAGLNPFERAVHERMAERVAALGEPWLSHFEPHLLAADLRELGFAVAEPIQADQVNRAWFDHRHDGLRLGGVGGLMWAGAAPLA